MFSTDLLAWYQRGHRPMPWRDESASPYHIWLAEMMLQQTTVAAVIPYYQRFLEHFPTIHHLAAAPQEEVMHLWQGLGYYRRATLLHACAKALVERTNGQFPNAESDLLALPGLGPYTAAVVRATAFNLPANVVDGNVERVIARMYRVETPLPAGKGAIRAHAATLAAEPDARANPRLYANALMELGSQVCTPKAPLCLTCPVQGFCQSFQHPDATTYPKKSLKKQLPHHTATVWRIRDAKGHIYLQQRPATGLLAHLWELPHSGWEPKAPAILPPPLPLENGWDAGTITHTFTHFKLTLEVVDATVEAIPEAHAFAPEALPPLSTLMKKALRL